MIRTTNTAIPINAIRERIVETCQLSSTSRLRVFVVMTTPPIDVGCDQSDFCPQGISDPAWGSRNDWAKIGEPGPSSGVQNVGY